MARKPTTPPADAPVDGVVAPETHISGLPEADHEDPAKVLEEAREAHPDAASVVVENVNGSQFVMVNH